jgi:deoxyribodipyrimidine photo-lyase
MTYNISIFIFRRDLRLNDNTGLIHAQIQSNHVIPLFICTPTQVSG